MARYEGTASIRRALSMPDGTALLDIQPDGSQWRWASIPAASARVAIALGIAAISGGWKLYISLPDDPTSSALEIVGLTNTRDQPASVSTAPGLVLHVRISPAPREGTRLTYTVTVTDASATPVDQAAVILLNYAVSGADEIHRQNTTGGIATFPNITLRSKTVKQSVTTGLRPRQGGRNDNSCHAPEAWRLKGYLRRCSYEPPLEWQRARHREWQISLASSCDSSRIHIVR